MSEIWLMSTFKFKFIYLLIAHTYIYINDIGPWGDKLEKLGLDKDKIITHYNTKINMTTKIQ